MEKWIPAGEAWTFAGCLRDERITHGLLSHQKKKKKQKQKPSHILALGEWIEFYLLTQARTTPFSFLQLRDTALFHICTYFI